MTPLVGIEVLEEFTPFSIQSKPEAPWLKRCSEGIKFTDEIQNDSRIQLITEGNFIE